MKDRLLLLLYFAATVSATLVHSIPILLSALGIIYLLAWRDAGAVAKRALLAVAFFNIVVTASYTIIGIVQGTFSPAYVVLVNLRVFLMTSMALLVVRRVNLFRAAAFAPPLVHLLTLTYGQIVALRRLLTDSRMAFRSRSIRRASLTPLYRHAASNTTYLFDRAIDRAGEITDAMRSRGFFDDSP